MIQREHLQVSKQQILQAAKLTQYAHLATTNQQQNNIFCGVKWTSFGF